MLVDGNAIKKEIRRELARAAEAFPRLLSVAVVQVGQDPVIRSYVQKKKRFAEQVGVSLEVFSFEESVAQERLLSEVEEIAVAHDGVVVQLPLPPHIRAQAVLDALPREKDIDCLGREAQDLFRTDQSAVLPPVAGAVKEIVDRYGVSLEGKTVVVLGSGALVGRPVAVWLANHNVSPFVYDRDHPVDFDMLRSADIIITGLGSAGFLQPDMIKEGAVILDAGTSDEKGTIAGDADPSCAEKAALFTPVPGGIGPVTVAVLFKNLFILAEEYGY